MRGRGNKTYHDARSCPPFPHTLSKVPQLFCRVALVLDLVLHAPALAQLDGNRQLARCSVAARSRDQREQRPTHEHDMVVHLLMLLILSLIAKPNTEARALSLALLLAWPCPGAKPSVCLPACGPSLSPVSRGFLPPSSSTLSRLHHQALVKADCSSYYFPFLLGLSIELCLAHSTHRKSSLFWDMTRPVVCSSFFHCVARFACRTPIIAALDAAIVAPRLPLR